MRASIEAYGWLKFNEPFEGGLSSGINYLIRDSAGRVATGYGIDFDTNDPKKASDRVLARREGLPKAQALLVHWQVRIHKSSRPAEVPVYPKGSLVTRE